MPARRTPVLATGPRVYVRHPLARDRDVFCTAVRRSRALHGAWVRAPAHPEGFAALMARTRRENYVSLFVCRIEDDAIVGVFNLSEIVRGALDSAYLGYYALAPYSGKGYMQEGLALSLKLAFGPIKLHRVESNIQPGNAPSLALVRRAGFSREGFSRRYLKIAGRWRDHERWALLVEDWREARRKPPRSEG